MKPLEANADTNMTVVTSKRIYSFMMFANQAVSYQGRDLTFHVKFTYPDEQVQVILYENAQKEAAAQRKEAQILSKSSVSPEDWNFSYQYDGSEAIRPQRVFDDGQFTYFKFPSITNTPAIFSVDTEGNEALINYNVKGEYIVVERIGSQFTLRDGSLATCIFNMALPNAEYDNLSPLRVERPSGLAALFGKKAG